MRKQSTAWKDLEKRSAEVLNGRRIVRRWDLFESVHDIEVPDFGLVCDCKRYQRFAHHALFDKVAEKYCKDGETPALITSTPRRQDPIVSLPLSFVARLLEEVRKRRKEQQT